MITYCKDKNYKSKKIQKYKTLTTIIKSFDTIVIIVTTSGSTICSLTAISLPISTGIACGSTISIKKINEKTIQLYKNYKKQYEEDQQTTKFFDKLYRKSFQDNIIDKNEY